MTDVSTLVGALSPSPSKPCLAEVFNRLAALHMLLVLGKAKCVPCDSCDGECLLSSPQ